MNNYEEFKNSLENEYNAFINDLIKWSASRQNKLIYDKVKDYFKDSLTDREINEIKTDIFNDIRDAIKENEGV